MRCAGVLLVMGLLPAAASGSAGFQDFDQTPCGEFVAPQRTVRGQSVGPVSCIMQETDVPFEGRTFRRLDIGIDGSVEGFVATTGSARGMLTNAPRVALQQSGGEATASFAVAEYAGEKGASMTLLYPLDVQQWNGKLWVTAHGEGQSFAGGQLRPWHKNLDRAKPLHDLSAYDRLILAKGYALAKTRRTSAAEDGDVTGRLENGSTLTGVSLADSAAYLADFTRLAERALADRLGKAPRRTYLYGHSAGASLARAVNYTSDLNAGEDGSPLFDGVLADQARGGVWLPLTDPGPTFVPQIDLLHQLYSTPWKGATTDPLSMSPLANGRTNAKLLQDKAGAARFRTYEVRGVSLNGGEQGAPDSSDETVDLSRLIDRLIDHLDAWVDQGTEPPDTRSDWLALGDTNGDGSLDRPAIAFPEVACPLGVHAASPALFSADTQFIPFGGDELEPLDEDGGFVDMNRNGIRDRRETPTKAWRRLGLLKPGEEFSPERYRECVRTAAERLRQEGFFSDDTVRLYLEVATAAASPSEAR